MKTLSDLTPAETLLLTEGKRVAVKDLLKVTLMDLLLKQVLKTIEVQNGATSFSNTYIVAGDNFDSIKPLRHELVFLGPFRKDRQAEILFNNLVKIGYQNARSEKTYNRLVQNSPALTGCFSGGLSQLFKPFALSNYGQTVSEKIKRQLNELSDTLPNLMESDRKKALEILKYIKGNVFLVKGIDFKRMAEIENAVVAEVYSTYSTSNGSFSDPMTWIALDMSSRTFDSSCSGCSTSDYSSDSDSGDSGCSGCSGCGGGGD